MLPIPVHSTGLLTGITPARRVTKLECFLCKEPNKPSSHPLSDTCKGLPLNRPLRLISIARSASPCLIIVPKMKAEVRLLCLQWNPQCTAEALELSLGNGNGNVGASPEDHGPPQPLALQRTFLVWTPCVWCFCPHLCFLTQHHDYLLFPASSVWLHFIFGPLTRIMAYLYFSKNVLLICQAMC